MNIEERNKLPSKPLVEVIWTDSCAPIYGWTSEETVDIEEYLIKTVGYIMDETETSLVIHMGFACQDTGALFGVFNIPKCAIKSRRML